jgi:DNA polymerase-3 subunit delta'
MDYINYLKNEQPVAYKTFYNAFTKNKIFHAYLLSGEIGTPLLGVAKFLAASLVCDNASPFACLNCSPCKRVLDENYGDLIVIDGKKDTIKKENIEYIESEFSKTSLEKKGIKVYIINLVENMNEDSINALLKFLEEPSENTYAFLTTENEYRVLPTILSRTQIIHFNLIDKEKLIKEAAADGVIEEDAELLANFYNDAEKIKEESLSEDYKEAKENVLNLFKKLKDKKELRFFIENDICTTLNTKPSVRYLFDFLIFFFKEAYIYNLEKNTIFKSYVKILEIISSNVKDLSDAILILMDARNELNYNLNTSLLILHTFKEIFEV